MYSGEFFIPDSAKPFATFIRQPIEWYLLEQDTKRDRALLLSRHILDWEGFANCPIFGSKYETSWKTSYLRLWLNQTFFQSAFSPEERKHTLTLKHAADGVEEENTADSVFLLSSDEIREYFPTKETAVALEPMIDNCADGSKEILLNC